MFICPGCFRQYIVGQNWMPPPCIFKSSGTIRELPEENKCLFTHIECECGQHIGVKVISGPSRTIGYWRMQFDCEDPENPKKDDYQVAKVNFTNAELKHIYQTEFINYVSKTMEMQIETKPRIFMVETMLKIFAKKARKSSI
jgi:hypothetical protein